MTIYVVTYLYKWLSLTLSHVFFTLVLWDRYGKYSHIIWESWILARAEIAHWWGLVDSEPRSQGTPPPPRTMLFWQHHPTPQKQYGETSCQSLSGRFWSISLNSLTPKKPKSEWYLRNTAFKVIAWNNVYNQSEGCLVKPEISYLS